MQQRSSSNGSKEMEGGMKNNHLSLEDLQNGNSQTQHSNPSDPHLQSFEPTASHDDFIEQMLSTLPNCSWPDLSSSSHPHPHADPNPNPSGSKATKSPWDHPLHQNLKSQDDSDDPQPTSDHPTFPSFEDLSSKLRHHVNGNTSSIAAAKSFLLQQQLLLSRGGGGGGGVGVGGLRSPSAPGGDSGLMPLPLSLASGDSMDSRLLVDRSQHDRVADASSFQSTQGDGSVQPLYNGFPGPLHGNGQSTSQQPFQAGAMPSQNFGGPGPGMNQAPASASTGGSGQAPQRQRVRARRGQATDPHSIAERLRRERIAERMKALQELVPNANKTDKASMLDEIIDYVKFLQLQVKVLSMSRLGGAAAVAPLVADLSSEGGSGGGIGRSSNGTHTVGSSTDSMSVTEHQVAKLMEEDMGSAMQYLQGKGLCLMPISLATAISTATCHTRSNGNLHNNNHRHHPQANGVNGNSSPMPPLNGNGSGNGNGAEGPSSPNLSGLTVQSANLVNGDGSVKDSTPASKASKA